MNITLKNLRELDNDILAESVFYINGEETYYSPFENAYYPDDDKAYTEEELLSLTVKEFYLSSNGKLRVYLID